MNSILTRSLFKGAAVFGVLLGVNLLMNSAKGAILTDPTSTLSWGDTTSNWYNEVQPGIDPATGSLDSFQIQFNFESNTIIINDATGDFEADFSTGLVSMDNAPQIGTFVYEMGSGMGTENSPALYVLQDELIMSFDPAPNSIAPNNPSDATEYDWVVPAGTRFAGFKPSGTTWQFNLCETCGANPYMLVNGMRNSGDNTFQFSDGSGIGNGNHIQIFQLTPDLNPVEDQTVPEPSSILSILSIASLGLIACRKKQH